MNLEDMKFGSLPASDTGFRVLCILLAGHPTYARQPLARATELLACVMLQQNFCCIHEGKLVGAVLWKEVSNETAREAIRLLRAPPPGTIQQRGPAIVSTAFIASTPDLVRPLWDRFVETATRGRIVLVERHYDAKPTRFYWYDKSGRMMGPDT